MVMNEPNRPGANQPGSRQEQPAGQGREPNLPAGRFSAQPDAGIEFESGAAGGAKQQIRQTAQRVSEQVRRQGADLAGRAQSQVANLIDQGKQAAAGHVGTLAEALRCAADKLRDDQQDAVAGYAQTAADQIQRLTGYLQDTQPGDMVRGVERFARRRPEVFIGASLAAGFAIGRFLKASGDRNWAEREARRESGEDWRRWEREPLDVGRVGGPGGFARPMGTTGVGPAGVSSGIPSYYSSGGNNPAAGGPTSGISAAATTPMGKTGECPPGTRPIGGGGA